jgi:cysteine synthase
VSRGRRPQEIDRASGQLDLISTVGDTPLIELRRSGNLCGRLFAKLEMRNPAGSVKDRLAVALIDDAEQRGMLKPGAVIVAATGGNTGIGLAFVAAVRGYPLLLTMPESMSRERVALLEQLGAQVELTPGILMTGAVALAQRRVEELPGAVLLDQFTSPANPEVHRRTTAAEIWEQTGGAVDAFVAAVGTGGTITGVGEVLKRHKPEVRIVAVEPAGAAVLSGRAAGQHQIPGIGVGFIPAVLNRSILDEVIAVSDADAFDSARRLARDEGIVAGASSGAAMQAARAVAMRAESTDSMIVVLLADTGDRYVTTPLFDQPGPPAH